MQSRLSLDLFGVFGECYSFKSGYNRIRFGGHACPNGRGICFVYYGVIGDMLRAEDIF